MKITFMLKLGLSFTCCDIRTRKTLCCNSYVDNCLFYSYFSFVLNDIYQQNQEGTLHIIIVSTEE